MGKTRLIAETGVGQHGVVTVTRRLRFRHGVRGLLGEGKILERQSLNVARMQLLARG